jgi:hypothetical protein
LSNWTEVDIWQRSLRQLVTPAPLKKFVHPIVPLITHAAPIPANTASVSALAKNLRLWTLVIPSAREDAGIDVIGPSPLDERLERYISRQ